MSLLLYFSLNDDYFFSLFFFSKDKSYIFHLWRIFLEMYWDIYWTLLRHIDLDSIFTAAAETKTFWRLLRHGSIFTRFSLVTASLWRYFCYISREPKFIASPECEEILSGEGDPKFSVSRSKVYRNVVKQLAPTRSMASFVLLQPTVLGRHVSAFRWMFRLGKAKPVTFSILDPLPHSVHTSNPSFNGARIIRSMNWPNKFYKRVSALLSLIHLYTL